MGIASSLIGFDDIPIFKLMRTLRALRPLRALSRFDGIRVSSKIFFIIHKLQLNYIPIYISLFLFSPLRWWWERFLAPYRRFSMSSWCVFASGCCLVLWAYNYLPENSTSVWTPTIRLFPMT